MRVHRNLLLAVLVSVAAGGEAATLSVDAAKVERTLDRHLLLGSNVAGWFLPRTYANPDIRRWIRDLGPIPLRLPGGSWGDGTFWNGNGVRHGNTVDYSKLDPAPYSPWSAAWGTWKIDYSAYAPGFLVDVKPNEKPVMISSTEWHGHVDVKTMHDFIRDVGGKPFVIVNGGTGSPRDAAEWVKWANGKMGYDVRYWEVGNELGGSWEAGHFLPDGKELNGEIFARRYEEFARAIKAVDPTVKVGCMDWLEDVLHRCPDLLDFFSIHAYPLSVAAVPSVDPKDDVAAFAKLGEVRQLMEQTRSIVGRVQPGRADRIEYVFSEWNMGWPDIRGALWHAGWVGEMFAHGAHMAQQWHAFDLMADDTPSVRRSLYWAFWLWSRTMGDTLVGSSLSGDPRLAAYTTVSEDGLSIMAINQSADEASSLDVSLAGFSPASEGRAVTFSRREFHWLDRDPDQPGWKKRPQPVWNTGPTVRPLATSTAFSVPLPPASITVLMIPREGRAPALEPTPARRTERAKLELHHPAEAYANDAVEVWVHARNGGEEAPYAGHLPDGLITVSGGARADRPRVRLSEAAGRFFLRADGPGVATVKVAAGDARASARIRFKSSVPKPKVLWEFEERQVPPGMNSHWALSFDGSIRPNQQVARIAVGGGKPQGDQKRSLLVIDLPKDDVLDRKNIRGAVFDLRTAGDFRCADPDAAVQVVMQSTLNWWIPLGSVKLSEHPDWKTVTLVTDDPAQTKAMPEALNLWFILQSKQPVFGSILIDRAGLMIR